MSKFTRWEVVFGVEDAAVIDRHGTICMLTDEMVAWKSNANLIAAAPVLLDALEKLLLDHICKDAGKGGCVHCELAHFARAKAGGHA